MRKLKQQKGITLVALIVTIIVLLILAGVTIESLFGDGMLEKAKLAAEEINNAEQTEKGILKEYEDTIESLGGSRNELNNSSTILKNIKITAKQNGGNIDIEIEPEFFDSKGSEDIYEYIVTENGKPKQTIKNTVCSVLSVKPSTEYNLAVYAIDNNMKMIKSNDVIITTSEFSYTEQLLNYPIITQNGVCNVRMKCNENEEMSYFTYDKSKGSTTASDSIPIEGYDGDLSTSAHISKNVDKGWIDVDESAIGKKITFVKLINCSIHKNSSSSSAQIDYTRSTTGVDLSFVITEGTSKLYFTTTSLSLGDLYFSDIVIDN